MLSLQFEGKSLPNGIIVESIHRPFINISTSTAKVPQASGELFRGSELGSKTIDVELRLIKEQPSAVHEVTHELKRLFYKKTPKQLILSDEPDKYELAILDGKIDFERFIQTGFIKLTFLCPSGVSYSIEESTETTNKGTADAPFVLSGTATGDEAVYIHSEEENKAITIDKEAVPKGTRVSVDMATHILKLNDRIDMKPLYIESEFFVLRPGENRLTVNGLDDGYAISYQARWL